MIFHSCVNVYQRLCFLSKNQVCLTIKTRSRFSNLDPPRPQKAARFSARFGQCHHIAIRGQHSCAWLQVGFISMEIKIVLLSSQRVEYALPHLVPFFAHQTFQKGQVSSNFWFTSNWFELFKRFNGGQDGKALSVAVDDWQCLTVLSVSPKTMRYHKVGPPAVFVGLNTPLAIIDIPSGKLTELWKITIWMDHFQ